MVVIHDETLNRTTDCTGNVKYRTLAYINACDTEPAGSHPPSFWQALTYLKGTDLKVTVHVRLGDSPGDYAAMQRTGAPVWVVQDVADAGEWLRGSGLR